MVVRLGFAIATALRPEILITDEVLAVGDESFQKKCIAWLEGYLEDGGTLLLCSHSMYHVQTLCSHALWIHHGRMHRYGPAADVTTEYLVYHEEKASQERRRNSQSVASAGNYSVTTLALSSGVAAGPTTTTTGLHRHALGDRLLVSGELHSPDGRTPGVSIGIVRIDGTPVYGLVSEAKATFPDSSTSTAIASRSNFRRCRCCRASTPCARMRSILRACACSIRSSAISSSKAQRASSG